MAKKHSDTRISFIYSETKSSLNKYYKREYSATKERRVVVWEKDGYSLMADSVEEKVVHK